VGGRRAQHGFSLTEIMIALVLGLALLAIFLAVLQRCREQFAINESLARLQDSARQVLSILVSDLEHAGFYGFSHSPHARLVSAGAVLAEADALRQPDSFSTAAAAARLPAGAHDCGINFAVDLELPVQGSDNTFAPGSGARDCAPTASAGGAHVGSDTLTVRHASLKSVPPHAGRLQIYTRRLAAFGPQDLFADGRAPGPMNEDNLVRDVEVRTYYIANNSIDHPGWPSLRMKALTEAAGSAQFRDEELLPGVEDLQVEFGVTDNGVMRYLPPDLETLRAHRVSAVRIWLRIRADVTEHGFTDSRTLSYAGVTFVPTAAESAQRRLLIERTVALRNLRDTAVGAP
jgi:prepilin-type N-terminal cleavage/methylation domain-containing protein